MADSFSENITTPAATFRLEISSAGPGRVDLRVMISTTKDPGGRPTGWRVYHSDRNQDLRKAAHRDALRRKLNLPPEQDSAILELLDKFEAWLSEHSATGAKPKQGEFTLNVRGIYGKQSKLVPVLGTDAHDALKKALSLSPSELPDQAVIIVPPEAAEDISFLDVDFHGQPLDQRPSHRDLDAMVDLILPRGTVAWPTHGNGLKMAFVRQGNLTAKLLADCAAAYALWRIDGCTVETATTARHPLSIRDGRSCGAVRYLIPDETLGILGAFSRMACPPDVAEKWRRENGIEVGERYGHEKCPIDPQHVSESPLPIKALDGGLYCHSCAARLGDGFRSWGVLAKLVPVEHDNPIYSAAKHLAHWEHVQYLFRELSHG